MSLDPFIIEFDKGLRTVLARTRAYRERPDAQLVDKQFTSAEKKHIAGLMRVNHCGEVCAQALYSGQSITARNPQIAQALKQAAQEEVDHLAWCEDRIHEMSGHKSFLNPLWYAGSFTLGALAGAVGDKWNLGFLAETERQVGEHLSSHLNLLPDNDIRTRAIIEQMCIDEANHASTAVHHGGVELPHTVKVCMKLTSKLMTKISYYF